MKDENARRVVQMLASKHEKLYVVKELTKEVAEQSTKTITGGNSLHYSSVPLPPPGIDCRQLDPQKAHLGSIFH